MPLEGKPNSAQMSSIDRKLCRGRLWLAEAACGWPLAPVAGRLWLAAGALPAWMARSLACSARVWLELGRRWLAPGALPAWMARRAARVHHAVAISKARE